jgi:hypothetical protein
MKMNGLIYIAQIKLSRKNNSFYEKGSRSKSPLIQLTYCRLFQHHYFSGLGIFSCLNPIIYMNII